MILLDSDPSLGGGGSEFPESREHTNLTINYLQRFADDAIDLEQTGYQSSATVALFGGGFSTNIDLAIPAAIVSGDCSMITIIQQPPIKEMLILNMQGHEEQLALLKRILPYSATDVMRLSRSQQNELESLQDYEASRRFGEGLLKRAYLARRGKTSFTGMFGWGLIDHNGTNFELDWEGEMVKSVRFAVQLATTLPHIRYVCEFTGDSDGRGAKVKQELRINPRVAFITDGFDQWYRRQQPAK